MPRHVEPGPPSPEPLTPPRPRPAGAPDADDRVPTRSEIAKQRTARTRQRLLAATLRVWGGEGGASEQAVIRHVIEVAEVSRATFYKHFSSLEEAAAALGRQLSDEMVEALRPIQEPVEDPLLRASLGIQMFLWRAVKDHRWAHFVSRSDHVIVDDTRFMRHVAEDLARGRDCGEFDIERLDVALTLNHGALKEGMLALSRGVEQPSAFIEVLATMMLVSFGVSKPTARTAVIDGAAQFLQQAPALYAWWTPVRDGKTA